MVGWGADLGKLGDLQRIMHRLHKVMPIPALLLF